MLGDSPVAVSLAAVDIDRAKSFFTGKLGLRVEREIDAGILFAAGDGTKIFIYERPEATKAEHTAAAFNVDDLDADVAELRSEGIVFEEYDLPGLKTVDGIATIGEVKSAWFKDSEGNIIAVTQM